MAQLSKRYHVNQVVPRDVCLDKTIISDYSAASKLSLDFDITIGIICHDYFLVISHY